MNKMMQKLVIVGLMLGLAATAGAGIIIGDFSSGYDGWQLVGNGAPAEDAAYRSMERVANLAATDTALRLNYLPPYPGWAGIAKSWDPTGQVGVTQLTIPSESVPGVSSPWIIHVLASFEGVGEIDSGWTFWPNGTLTYTAGSFGVTAAQFNKINGVRISMDATSGTNGGTGNPMWVQIYDVSLNGVVPEPASLGLLALGGLLLARRRHRVEC